MTETHVPQYRGISRAWWGRPLDWLLEQTLFGLLRLIGLILDAVIAVAGRR